MSGYPASQPPSSKRPAAHDIPEDCLEHGSEITLAPSPADTCQPESLESGGVTPMAIPPSLVVCMILPCRLVFIGGVLEPEEWVGARQLVARRQVEMDGRTGHAACSPDARDVGARALPSWRLRWCNLQHGARYICAAIGSYFIPSARSFDGIVSNGVEERCQCSQVMYPAVNQDSNDLRPGCRDRPCTRPSLPSYLQRQHVVPYIVQV